MGLRDEIRDLKRQLAGPEPDPALVAHKVCVYQRAGLVESEEEAFEQAYRYASEAAMGWTPADRIRAKVAAERLEAHYGAPSEGSEPPPYRGSGTSSPGSSTLSAEWHAEYEKALRAERARLEKHDLLRELVRDPHAG